MKAKESFKKKKKNRILGVRKGVRGWGCEGVPASKRVNEKKRINDDLPARDCTKREWKK